MTVTGTVLTLRVLLVVLSTVLPKTLPFTQFEYWIVVGSGSNSGVIAGVDWVAENAISPAVANMSLGGGASSALDQAVERAPLGVVFVVAAGNSNANACNSSPARTENAITVGSTDSSDRRSSFSNYGSCVDIFAPGSSITSAYNSSDSFYAKLEGTSMASPHVAGAVALLLEDYPNDSTAKIEERLLANATKQRYQQHW